MPVTEISWDRRYGCYLSVEEFLDRQQSQHKDCVVNSFSRNLASVVLARFTDTTN
jgi:hypothetical protein